jgi:hypothetical protein
MAYLRRVTKVHLAGHAERAFSGKVRLAGQGFEDVHMDGSQCFTAYVPGRKRLVHHGELLAGSLLSRRASNVATVPSCSLQQSWTLGETQRGWCSRRRAR